MWSHQVTPEYGHGMEPAWGGKPGGDGRIPFTFRIGVTGHRDLADPDATRRRIREAIAQLLTLGPGAPGAGLALVVVSALAEGADRLVAAEVLADPDSRLEVAIPLPVDDYVEDFRTEESKEEFRRLLARARPIDIWAGPGWAGAGGGLRAGRTLRGGSLRRADRRLGRREVQGPGRDRGNRRLRAGNTACR